jgi:hypothetical protein
LHADSTKQTSWAKDVKSQLEQLKQAVEKPITKPPEHAHIGNRNKRIPQFRSAVETELSHIGNRKPEDTAVQVRHRD